MIKNSLYLFVLISFIKCSAIQKIKVTKEYFYDFDLFDVKGIKKINGEIDTDNFVICEFDSTGTFLSARFKREILNKKRYIKNTQYSDKFISTMSVPLSPYKMVDTIVRIDANTIIQKAFVVTSKNKIIETNDVLNDMTNQNKHFSIYQMNKKDYK